MTTVDSMIASFPVPVLPRITGRPTYDSIALLTTDIHRNTASVHSKLGGGANGHLGTSLNPPIYATVSNVPWQDPPNPGPMPNLPPAANQTLIRALERQHDEALRVWRQFTLVQDAIKAQIIQAIEPMYLETLNNRYTGFAGITIRAMITHLYNHYGAITAHDLETNNQQFRTAYDPAQPIELLYKQIEDAMLYADAGHQAYTAIQIVNNAYNLVSKTGLFKRTCREWRNRIAADRTWENFKTAFTAAWLENKEDELITTQGHGYQSANHVDQWANETAEAFANLASATASDRNTIQALVATTQDLTAQLAIKDKTIADLRTALNNKTPAATGRSQHGGNLPTNKNYCWTHGYILSDQHTSATCTRKAPGHVDAANRTDTKNGSTRGKHLLKD
jgi:hypothetical protein